MKVWLLIMWAGHGAYTVPALPSEEECLRLKTEIVSKAFGGKGYCIQYHIKGLSAP